ncbi:uncharacterized protein LOC132699350 [Cylas formicarius]|uniref:uncharacterized protein LOC132699350 n=1 Tax=Cylas formicarius TaxID=197179 RepID=UPI0029583F7C|nr:uncharacterized protein LOC132699350 [Cylas formicarius]
MEDTRLTFNGSSIDNKFTKMKRLLAAIQQFLESRAEDQAILINQYLQALSLSLELTIFDPHTNIAGQFFISLYDLFNTLEPRSLTSWYCIDVLSNACKNTSARESLIKNYNFIPCLARLIGDHLTTDKKTRLLKLMQDLSCGIKISWQFPHLTHLMTTLARWVEGSEPEVVTLSLAVLVNLCYKNITAIYTLQRNVDLKKFVRICLSLKGPIVEVYVCQIAIILETISCYIPCEIMPKFIDSTFIAIKDAFTHRDIVLLRQVVEFFVDSVRGCHNNPLNQYSNWAENISQILEMIEDNTNEQDPECMSQILEFIHFLADLKVPTLSSQYPRLISFAVKWINESPASFQAFALLKTIAVNAEKQNNGMLEALVVGLPVFLALLNEESMPNHVQHHKRLGALLQLLKAVLQVKSIRGKVLQELHEDLLSKIFRPLLGDDSPEYRDDTCTIEAVNLYIYGLALIAELVKCDKSWLEFLNSLLSNRQMHIILARAICQSPTHVKKLALELSGTSCSVEVSQALEKLQSLVTTVNKEPCSHSGNGEFAFNLIPVAQNQRLDGILDKIESKIARNETKDISTSELMELYSYKISYLTQAERAALLSIDASTKHCTHLQHRIERLTIEHNKLQQSEFHTVQKLEEVLKQKEETNVMLRDLQNRVEAEKGKNKACLSQLKLKEKALSETEAVLEETKAKLIEMTKVKNNVEEQLNKLQQLFAKADENGRKLQKNLQKKEETLKKAESSIENYVLQVNDLEKSLKEKITRLNEVQAQLQLKSSILENITKMANSQMQL